MRTSPFVLPWTENEELIGVLDLIDQQLITFDKNDQGATVSRSDLPAAAKEQFEEARESLLEAAAEGDEAIMAWYLEREGAVPESAAIRAALRKRVIAGEIVPVFAGTALHNLGVQTLLDGVISYLPSPLDWRQCQRSGLQLRSDDLGTR